MIGDLFPWHLKFQHYEVDILNLLLRGIIGEDLRTMHLEEVLDSQGCG